MIISAKDISKAFGAEAVLRNITFSVEEGEKAAFVGLNGAGKTTLFKIISGELGADSGIISTPKGTSIACLSQNAEYESGQTVYQELVSAFDDVFATEMKIRETETAMSLLSPQSAEYARLLEDYNRLMHFYEENDGYSCESRVRGVMAGLGLAPSAEKKINELSGGQKTRAALGRELLKKPDILLLDEPTNHLDIDALSWLETYLKSYSKTVLLISHDRYFIDAVATQVIDVENGKAYVYNGTYSQFIERKASDFAIAQKHYKDRQKEIKKQEESIKLLKSYNRQKTVKRAESMEKRLAKTERLEKPVTAGNMVLSFKPKLESGFDVLSVMGLSKSYGNKKLFDDISFDIKKGERIALIGANGTGKTTILKIIMAEVMADKGSIRKGVNLKIGYYDQERQRLTASKSLIEQVSDNYPHLSEGEIRNALAAFLFRGDDVYKQISALSGGERGRLCLALLMLQGANFLIMDEPTNHLDTYSKEVLEKALKGYNGTLLCVSHDRYFINKTAERIIELTESGIKNYLGDYSYYLQKKSAEEAYMDVADINVGVAPNNSGNRNLHLERKAEAASARKKQNALKRIEEKIAETELRIKECDELMCDKDVFTDAARAKEAYDRRAALEQELSQLYADWDEADRES